MLDWLHPHNIRSFFGLCVWRRYCQNKASDSIEMSNGVQICICDYLHAWAKHWKGLYICQYFSIFDTCSLKIFVPNGYCVPGINGVPWTYKLANPQTCDWTMVALIFQHEKIFWANPRTKNIFSRIILNTRCFLFLWNRRLFVWNLLDCGMHVWACIDNMILRCCC